MALKLTKKELVNLGCHLFLWELSHPAPGTPSFLGATMVLPYVDEAMLRKTADKVAILASRKKRKK